MRFGACALLLTASCGRIGFDPSAGAGDDAGVSTLADARSADAPPALPGMSFVTEGQFVMGSDPGEGATDEEPELIVTLTRGYYIDKYEVTTREYRDCVLMGGCTGPAVSSSNTRATYYTNTTFDDYPVIHVTWNQADAYCAWKGKRLPTGAEWEKAARGGCEIVAPATCGPEDERKWPWGDVVPTCAHANIGDTMMGIYCTTGGDTDRVGARSPMGDSPYGISDLSSNVWEWVSDRYATDYTWCTAPCTDPAGSPAGSMRTERGGGFYVNDLRVTTTFHAGLLPTDQFDDLGFRCAKSL